MAVRTHCSPTEQNRALYFSYSKLPNDRYLVKRLAQLRLMAATDLLGKRTRIVELWWSAVVFWLRLLIIFLRLEPCVPYRHALASTHCGIGIAFSTPTAWWTTTQKRSLKLT